MCGIIGIVGSSSVADRLVFGILVQDIKAEFSLSDFELGLLGGLAFSLVYVLAGFPAARLADEEQDALQRYLDHLQNHPSMMAASRWLNGAKNEVGVLPAPVQKTLENATKPLARYRCAACGFEAKEHFWHCPGCQSWDSYPPRRVEEL